MTEPSLALTARLNTSAADSRRGLVRVHPEVLAALSLREWDAISLTGARTVTSVVARASDDVPPGTLLLDDITFSNLGVRENTQVIVGPVTVYGASKVTVSGSSAAVSAVADAALRRALLGKIVSVGDAVALLPRDLGPDLAASEATQSMARALGITWTNELLTVTATEPAGPVSVQTNTAVVWASSSPVEHSRNASPPVERSRDALPPVERSRDASPPVERSRDASPPVERSRDALPPLPVAELVGVDSQTARLTEWLSVTLDSPDILAALGAQPRLGVLVTGPSGVGKATVVRSVCADRPFVEIDGPTTGALVAESRRAAVSSAVARLRAQGPGVLLITDVDALLPVDADPVSTLILDDLRSAIGSGTVALVATSADATKADPRLREPDLCDRSLTIGLPDAPLRAKLLAAILRSVPVDGELDFDDVAAHTPGFVAADLAAVVRDAALRAAARAAETSEEPALRTSDLTEALAVVRPASRLESPDVALGSITLDDVGDMVETRQALTEAVLWPLQHPDTFTRLGVDPPRGVLLYGPPGCGKTFVVRALAASGRLSVHTVKGAELLDKWVGASERAVRDLFTRARESAPSLIFLDEVDALAPRRGGSTDSGVADRVVAALLTELDGVEPLSDVVVLGATNRPDLIDPALLRPGRLERLVFVPPPNAAARADILRASSRNVPLAEIDLDALATDLDGYSAADCSALLREAALAAMRRDIEAATVTSADLDVARAAVRPSLDPDQVAELEAYAERRRS
ncbi:transitional endoplasmic reticulum ATPase [Gordonia malaquae]|uniref:Putative ATPase n=1 Tax=Gordonia malaquae NBRC 108250 TaxID=1223542 RepID=M3VG09_GORML|nr:AAA family ATPase [Gordonia malaquae]GAC80529.1 putative ATPase [Gordonia malaquae NBRC 108250]SEE18024.1 transitional endoplasmic reticulum ATPase [Gordonia malaquae]